MHSVLVVEDKASMAKMLKETLEARGYQASVALDGDEGVEKIASERPDIVITDLKLPKRNGMEVLKSSKDLNPLRPVIMMTAFGSVETAVSAMKEGAFDFITKPFSTDHLIVLIERAIENQRLVTENILLKEEHSSLVGLPTIIGKSKGIASVADKIRKASPAKTTILFLGESGTGKELFARAVHQLSGRNEYPFVPVNCAAIPHELLESELFGYEKGAFTGAESRRFGKFELASHGTLFLDEIGELDASLQAKLLRALQEGEIERIGGDGPIKVDVRVVAASNKDLRRAVEEGEFREDLYYRLNVFPIDIPPLRDRKSDIPLLVEYFMAKFTAEMKSGKKEVSDEATQLLMDYDWKGNVRELQNAIERAIILSSGSEEITPEHISLTPARSAMQFWEFSLSGSLEKVAKEALRAVESERIKRALEESGGNKSRAAKALEVSYKTLLTKIKDYGLT